MTEVRAITPRCAGSRFPNWLIISSVLPFANLTGDDGQDYFTNGHLLTLQAEIAQEVARQIQLTFANRPENASRQATLAPNALQAYDLYLKGRYFWNKRTTLASSRPLNISSRPSARIPPTRVPLLVSRILTHSSAATR